jgi:hypothetical protein
MKKDSDSHLGYSLLAVGYSKKGEYQEMVLTSFKEDN